MPERVDVLAKERDFAVAGSRQRSGLGDDLVEWPAPLRATAEWDDAVGAGLVAAIDDRQPGRRRRLALNSSSGDHGGACARQVVRRADRRSSNGGRGATHRGVQPDRSLGRRKAETVDELRLLVGPEEQVDGRKASPK